MAISADGNKALVRRFREGLDAGDPAVIDGVLAANGITWHALFRRQRLQRRGNLPRRRLCGRHAAQLRRRQPLHDHRLLSGRRLREQHSDCLFRA
jgi:hypothetical protein